MSGISNQNTVHAQVLLDPTALLGNLDTVKKQSQTSLNQALQNLGVLIASPNASGTSGAQSLQKPSAMNLNNVSDMTLRMGLLQEALNQLQEQVSKGQIQAKLTQENTQGKEQIQQLNQHMEEMQKAYKKDEQARAKAAILGAIFAWLKPLIDLVVAIVTAIAAVAEALVGDEVGAGALFASSGLMFAAFAVDTALAVNQTVGAIAGNSGFLSQSTVNTMDSVSTTLQSVAGAVGLVGGVGAAIIGMSKVTAILGEQAAQEGMEMSASLVADTALAMGKTAMDETFEDLKQAAAEFFKRGFMGNLEKLAEKVADIPAAIGKRFDELAKTFESVLKRTYAQGIRDAAAEDLKEVQALVDQGKNFSGLAKTVGSKMAAETYQEAAKDTFKQAMELSVENSMKNFTKLGERLFEFNASVEGIQQIGQGAGNLAVDNMKSDAAMQQVADQDEAKLKAIEAGIAKLEKLIQQMQDDLQKMMQGMMNSVSSILNAASDSSDAVGKLIQSSSA